MNTFFKKSDRITDIYTHQLLVKSTNKEASEGLFYR